MCRRFGTLFSIFIGGVPAYTTYKDGIECSGTLAHKIQKPENWPKERIQHSAQGESLKSRTELYVLKQINYK
jgi:hypothetical protein